MTSRPRQLIEDSIQWDSWFQRVRVHDHHGKKHDWRQALMAVVQKLRAYILRQQLGGREKAIFEWPGLRNL